MSDSFSEKSGTEVGHPIEHIIDVRRGSQGRKPQDLIIDLLSNPDGLSKTLGLNKNQTKNAQVASIVIGALTATVAGEKTIQLNKALGPTIAGAIYGAIGGALGGKFGKDLFEPTEKKEFGIF